ncbi:hypothetical protein MCEMSE15_00781 [Fimbriimonadaceae bacterium]
MDSIKQLLKTNRAFGSTCLFALLSAASLASAWHGPSYTYFGSLVWLAYLAKSMASENWRYFFVGLLALLLVDMVHAKTNLGVSLFSTASYCGLIAFEVARDLNARGSGSQSTAGEAT